MDEQLLTLEELADYLKLSKMTIYRMVKKNTIPAIKVANQWRFDKKEIDLWLSEYKKKFVSDTRDEPKQHFNMEHHFAQKYRPIFQEFFNREFEKNPPDYIVLLDRKGAKIIEALNIIPKEYVTKIFYPDSFKWMPDHILRDKVKGKAIAIIDEMVQYGNNLRKQQDFFKDKKATVKTYTLARRKLYFEIGKLRDPYVKACLDLDDTSFIRFTAEMSKFFFSEGIPLDVDHVSLKIIPKEGFYDIEKLLEYFASLGKIYFIPTSYRENEKIIITIDNPIFFNILDAEIPEGLEAEGVCKLRMYLHRRDGYFFLVPIVFPKLKIKPESFIKEVTTNRHLYSSFCAIGHIKDFSSINPKYQAEYFFRVLSLYLSTLMASKFIQFVNGTNDYIQITPDTVSINREDFIRNYGNAVGSYLYELVEKEIYSACIEKEKGVFVPIKPSTTHTLKIAGGLPELDNEYICETITNFLFEEKKNKRSHEERISQGLSFTEIKDKLPDLSGDDISKAFDILLDRGVIKPLNEARPNTDNAREYLYLRTYRKGEYDDPLYGPWSEVSLARTDETFATEQIIRLIPFTLERLMQLIPSQKNGVIPTLANKVFANLQHDWNYEEFGALFLYWKPYYFGPLVGVPKKCEPFGGWHSLSTFANKHKTYFWDNKLKIFKPSYDIDWKKDLQVYLTPLEEDIFTGLIDIYSSIYSKCNDSSTNILITLSACRNERLTYIHCYKNIELWKEAFDTFLCQLKLLELTNLEKGNMALEGYLEDIAKPISLLGEKLKRFKELRVTKRTLQEKLQTHSRAGLVRAILESIEEPPKITEDITRLENVYLATSAFNNIVRQLFSQLGLALDTRKSKTDSETGEIKDTRWYAMKEFLPLLPAQVKEEFLVFLEKLFQTVNCGSLKVETCNAIENIYRKIKLYYIDNDEYLPKPAINKMESEEKFKKFSEAKSRISVREERAVAYLDIQGYGPLSKNISEIFDPTKIEDPPDPQELRKKWSQSIERKIQEIRTDEEIIFRYTPDSWIFAYKNVDNLLGKLCKIMDYAKENNIFLKCVVDWGNPDIQGRIPYGDPYITAYRICEESGVVKGNQIIITQRLKEKIVGSSYIGCLIELDDVPVEHIEQPVKVYKFEWKKVIGKNE